MTLPAEVWTAAPVEGWSNWGPAEELVLGFDEITNEPTASSLLVIRSTCPKCGEPYKEGQWVRWRYGPRGGIHAHDDCLPDVR